MDTLELTSFVSYLSATRKELFNKLSVEEWEDVLELLTLDYTYNKDLEDLKDIWVEEGYIEGQREAQDEYDRGYDKGFEDGEWSGYERAKDSL